MDQALREKLQVVVEGKLAAMASARSADGIIAILAGEAGMSKEQIEAEAVAIAQEAIEQDAWFKQRVADFDACFLPPYGQEPEAQEPVPVPEPEPEPED